MPAALPLPPPLVVWAAVLAERDLVELLVGAALRGRVDVVVDERAMWTPCDTRSAEVVEGSTRENEGIDTPSARMVPPQGILRTKP